jgi:hypothetical protein
MKRVFILVCLSAALATTVSAQRRTAPQLSEEEEDTLTILTPRDSAIFRGRITASEKPFSECNSRAFQTCASGDTEARLSADGTAYGVLMTRQYDGRSSYLWKLSGRATVGPGAGGAGGRGRGGGARGGGRGAKRRG